MFEKQFKDKTKTNHKRTKSSEYDERKVPSIQSNGKNLSTYCKARQEITSKTYGTQGPITTNRDKNSSINKKNKVIKTNHLLCNSLISNLGDVSQVGDSNKHLSTPAFLFQMEYEVENRRMSLEMIKYMNH